MHILSGISRRLESQISIFSGIGRLHPATLAGFRCAPIPDRDPRKEERQQKPNDSGRYLKKRGLPAERLLEILMSPAQPAPAKMNGVAAAAGLFMDRPCFLRHAASRQKFCANMTSQCLTT